MSLQSIWERRFTTRSENAKVTHWKIVKYRLYGDRLQDKHEVDCGNLYVNACDLLKFHEASEIEVLSILSTARLKKLSCKMCAEFRLERMNE